MSYKQITTTERYIIKGLLDNGISKSCIAKQLGRHPSTIGREIYRNSGLKNYRPKQANEFAENRKIIKVKVHKMTHSTINKVNGMLKQFWSPEQISSVIKELYSICICPLTIYRYIARNKANGGNLWRFLRQANRRRRKKYGSLNSRGYIPNRVSIEERPDIVDRKNRIGDWELDTMIGSNHKGVLLTIVERKSKFTLIGKCKDKSADSVTSSILALLKPYKDMVKTLTMDNGKEFAGHEIFSEKLSSPAFFAHPYSSWERGLNENTNGLIRQFFPKGHSLKMISKKSIKRVMDLLNYRPRKTLGFKMPVEILHKQTINKKIALGM